MDHTIWRKALEKRATRRAHASNFRAGEVAADQHYLERTGIRGRKRWILLLAVVILTVVIIGNFVLTCILCGVLRIRVDGTAFLKFDDDGDVIFRKRSTIDELRLASDLTTTDEQRNFRSDQSILLESGTDRSAATPGATYDPTQLDIMEDNVFFNPFSSVSIQDLHREMLYINKRRIQFDFPTTLNTLRATKVVTNRVNSPSDMLATADEVLLKGIGGISQEGRTVNLTATNGIALQSQKSIDISGASLVLPQLPVASLNVPQQASLKLCACRISNTTSFRLFLSPSSCLAANNTHPCL